MKLSIASFVIFSSLVLLLVQSFGLFSPPESFPSQGNVLGYNIQTVDPKKVLSILRRPERNPTISWLDSTNNTVFGALIHGDHARLRFEHNWVLWTLSKFKGDVLRYTQNPKKIIASGSAICSQSAAVITAITKLNNLHSRFVSFDGHVITEVKIDNKWYAVDTDYGVVYPFDVDDLVNPKNKKNVEALLIARGYDPLVIHQYIQTIHTNNFSRHAIWKPHEPKRWMIERWSTGLSWGLPIFGIILGITKISFHKRKRYFGKAFLNVIF